MFICLKNIHKFLLKFLQIKRKCVKTPIPEIAEKRCFIKPHSRSQLQNLVNRLPNKEFLFFRLCIRFYVSEYAEIKYVFIKKSINKEGKVWVYRNGASASVTPVQGSVPAFPDDRPLVESLNSACKRMKVIFILSLFCSTRGHNVISPSQIFSEFHVMSA